MTVYQHIWTFVCPDMDQMFYFECHLFLSSVTYLKNMSFHVSKHILFLDFIYGQVHCTLNV